jgi:hypothetical protein
MGLPTAKGTPQITAACIPWVGKKKYSAMTAPAQALAQMWMKV